MANFVDHLGDILFTPIAEELPNAMLLRINLIKHVLDPQLMFAQNRRIYITLLGSPYALQGLAFSYSPSLNAVYKWLDSVVQLTSLHLLQGFDETVCDSWDNNARDPPPQQDWNSILLRHKDTLEELVFDGYRGVRDCNYSGEEDQRNIARFGPTETLSCLPKLQKLAYLKLPLHFLVPQADSHFIDEETSRESLPSPSTAPEALALVEPSFPPSLKRLDIVVYRFYFDEERVGEMYPFRTITVKF
ncbi:hypothetical protein SMACR_08453 [Sordaria macrospora]|uniref:WGS project CABT00000000 data, contig 2.51 n=2 Tax=Sordaria macrospora TaxID=5147 RepID=F7W9F3_SORMK|nr:uncharacterized protein SMAC_08453 [Sordaria macrospora k-hell]KAA8629516.1 hypothetical protein SMACR_08453 [Sordaria macrospora]WPJ64256.1 hypothetical protein SMAC4_08453 [Sordaria macrospora]CCC13944.1 unnamed protein product [Sordaria macrospora k-hell]